MKLLFCKECHDLVRLFHEDRRCHCGAVGGRYIDHSRAEVWGGENAVSVAIGNGSLCDAMDNLEHEPKGMDRKYYMDNCRVGAVWVRPHSGPGNPHTTEIPIPDVQGGCVT